MRIAEGLGRERWTDADVERRLDVPPHRVAIDPGQTADRPLRPPHQPKPQNLLDLDHRDLPERHGSLRRQPASAS